VVANGNFLSDLKIFSKFNIDGFVKSQESQFSVIPAKAGIQSFQPVTESLDSGFQRGDDFLHGRQY